MSKIVVLGADGFIGRHLVERLSRDPEKIIIGFDRFSRFSGKQVDVFLGLNNVSVVPGDFFNEADLEKVLNGADVVFHLITTTKPADSDKNLLIDIETNIKYSVRLFELCVKAKVKKVVYPSSGGTIYGDIDSDGIDELTLPAPRSPYGIAKLTIENYLRYFKYNHGLNYIVYRISNPYGPGQNIRGNQGVIPIFMHKILQNMPLTIYGNGEMVRDYIYIEDLTEMIYQSFERDNQRNEYNVGSGQGISINELINLMQPVTNMKIKRQIMEQPSSFVKKSVLDISRYVKEFGIKPVTPMDVGLKKTWEYVRSIN